MKPFLQNVMNLRPQKYSKNLCTYIISIVIVEVETTFDVLGCQKLVEVFQSNIICLKLSYVTIKYITNITSEHVS